MSKRKLLLADDSITIQKVVNLTFADEGIEVIAVGDGNSAMDKLREDSPDLVMADVNMPGLNGYEICEKIKQMEGNGNTPVILLVGSFEPFDEDEAIRVGADDYLTKPFQSISQLVEKVSGLLRLGDGLKDENLEDTAEMPFIEPEIPSSDNDLNEFADNEAENFESFSDDFDDEMIHTEQIRSFPLDETVKYESTSDFNKVEDEIEPVEDQTVDYEIAETNFQAEQEILMEETEVSESDFSFGEDGEIAESIDSYEVEDTEIEDLHQTQPLTQQDYQELSIESDSNEVETPEQYEFAESEVETDFDSSNLTSETELTEEDVETEKEATELPMPDFASALELDEINLLELPPLEGFEDASPEPHIADSMSSDLSQAKSDHENISEIVRDSGQNISNEMVEVITQKVVERLSDKAVREIAWEVVPQMADLIIKKMAEEKMKE